MYTRTPVTKESIELYNKAPYPALLVKQFGTVDWYLLHVESDEDVCRIVKLNERTRLIEVDMDGLRITANSDIYLLNCGYYEKDIVNRDKAFYNGVQIYRLLGEKEIPFVDVIANIRSMEERLNEYSQCSAVLGSDNVNLSDARLVVLANGVIYEHINYDETGTYYEGHDPHRFQVAHTIEDLQNEFDNLTDEEIARIERKWEYAFSGNANSMDDIRAYDFYYGIDGYGHVMNGETFIGLIDDIHKRQKDKEKKHGISNE